MKITIGTTSEQKIDIIKRYLNEKGEQYEITPNEVDSGITEQPIDEETVIIGSINRARNAMQKNKSYSFSLGLEGGLSKANDLFHLVCVASIIDTDGNIFTGISKKMPLPKEVSEKVKRGDQFGIAIREFEREVDTKENSNMKKLVSELINRTESFREAFEIALLKYKNKKYFR